MFVLTVIYYSYINERQTNIFSFKLDSSPTMQD